MRMFLMILFLLITLNKAYAWTNPKNLRNCSDSPSSYSCDSSCKLDRLDSINFSVNPQNNTVLLNYYIEGKLVGSDSLKNCKVVDSNNWNCSNVEHGALTYSLVHAMTNSNYTNVLEYKDLPNLNAYRCVK